MRDKKFDEMIDNFKEIYQDVPTLKALQMYIKICEEIPSDEAEAVTSRCLQRCKFFPKPAEIYEAFEFIHTGDSYMPEEIREERRKEEKE